MNKPKTHHVIAGRTYLTKAGLIKARAEGLLGAVTPILRAIQGKDMRWHWKIRTDEVTIYGKRAYRQGFMASSAGHAWAKSHGLLPNGKQIKINPDKARKETI